MNEKRREAWYLRKLPPLFVNFSLVLLLAFSIMVPLTAIGFGKLLFFWNIILFFGLAYIALLTYYWFKRK